MATSDIAAPYSEGLTRRQWSVLGITMLFWLFDGYETLRLLLTIGPSLHQLLPANELATLPRVAAYLISITLFGWAVGGVHRRHCRRPPRTPLDHDWRGRALQHFHRHQRAGAELAVPGADPVPHRLRHRRRMGRRHLAVAGDLAGTAAHQGRGRAAGGIFRRLRRRLGVVARARRLVRRLLALDVCRRHHPGFVRSRAGPRYPGVRALDQSQPHGGVDRRDAARAIPATLCSRSWFRFRSRLASGRSRPGCRPMWRRSHPTRRAACTMPAWPDCSTRSAKSSDASLSASCPTVGAAAARWPSILPARSRLRRVVFLCVRDPHNRGPGLQIVNGFLTGGLYGWFAIHPPELFPTAARSTAISLIFNFARFLAMFGPILASSLIGFFGGYGPAATTLASIFAVGYRLFCRCFRKPKDSRYRHEQSMSTATACPYPRRSGDAAARRQYQFRDRARVSAFALPSPRASRSPT